ncbi:MAG: DUF1501 domain-containing protein [Planctomycetaceae bacterium]
MTDTQNSRSSVSRRDFLRVGGLSVVGLSLAERQALADSAGGRGRRSCIFLLMAGGPSQLETFDPKPEAPSHIRGPMKAISTAVPGVFFADALPRLAERADRFALIRSLRHESTPIHETGYQLLQTGRLSNGGPPAPGFGSLIAKQLGPRDGAPPFVVVPKLLTRTGVEMYRGQSAGELGPEFDPVVSDARTDRHACDSANGDGDPQPVAPDRFLSPDSEPESLRRKYGESRFGRLCLHARQLVETGVRCVVVNLFDRLAGELTWDCHGRNATTPGTLYDYRDTLCPQFDRAVSALLDDLHDRGLFDETLVVATGEFGRTPRINAGGGRDHWPGVWSAMLAGGGSPGGMVLGGSDAHAAAPVERPVSPAELVSTILQTLDVVPAAVDGEDDSLAAPLPVMPLDGGAS